MQPQLLFTENESNVKRLLGVPNRTLYVKDGINAAVVSGFIEAVNPNSVGTKVVVHYDFSIASGATETMLLRLSAIQHTAPFEHAEEVFKGDTGRGVGASHQTGWTGMVAKLLEQTHGR